MCIAFYNFIFTDHLRLKLWKIFTRNWYDWVGALPFSVFLLLHLVCYKWWWWQAHKQEFFREGEVKDISINISFLTLEKKDRAGKNIIHALKLFLFLELFLSLASMFLKNHSYKKILTYIQRTAREQNLY